MKITVLDITDMTSPEATSLGCLRAYASIQIGPLVLHRVRLLKEPGRGWDVLPPCVDYMEADGKTLNWILFAAWPEIWEADILEAVKDAYETQRQATHKDEKQDRS